MTLNFTELQKEVGEWAHENFGEQPAHWCLKGALEELGELCTSDLKTDQGLADTPKYQERGTVGPAAERDAVGDIVIYLMDYCHRSGAYANFHGPRSWRKRWRGITKDEAISFVAFGLSKAHKEAVKGDRGSRRGVEAGLREAIRGLRLFCLAKDYDFEECVEDAAEEVLGRDWNKERKKV